MRIFLSIFFLVTVKLSIANVNLVNMPSVTPDSGITVGEIIDTTQYYVNQARSVIKHIRDSSLFADFLSSDVVYQLPIGIRKEIGGHEYIIGISNVDLYPTHASLTAYMSFEIPQNGQTIEFMAKDIHFTKDGGLTGNARLELIKDVEIPIGSSTLTLLKGQGDTYVDWDCDGFQSMGIKGDVTFPENWMIPADTSTAPDSVVHARFQTVITEWSDFIASLDMDPFEIKGLNGVDFTVTDAVIDLSDLNNPISPNFPQDYQTNYMPPGNPNLWQGFYLRQLNVELPEKFERQDGQRTSFTAQDLIIDDNGLTGKFYGLNLIATDQGSMGGWAYSLDSLGVELMAGQFISAGFNGEVQVPVFKENSTLAYTGIINPDDDEYIFSIQTNDSLEMSMWKAQVDLYPTSSITIAVVNDKFRPSADLTGQFSINAGLGGDDDGAALNLAEISFEHLVVQSEAPYLQVQSFTMGSPALQEKMSDFPISINNIGLTNRPNNEVSLDFDLIVNFVGESNNAFGGDAGISIIGKLDESNSWQSWKYERILVDTINVNADIGAVKMEGQVVFYDEDPFYGKGFSGFVKLEVEPKIEVQASCIFGTVNDMRYWYADALASFDPGIPIFTGVALYGVGGGAYYRMKQSSTPSASSLGNSISGTTYVPEPNNALGVKLMVKIGTSPTKESFNGDIGLEIVFNNSGGVNQIMLYGNGYFMTPPLVSDISKLKEKTEKLANIEASLNQVTGGLVGSKLDDFNNSVDNLTKDGNLAASIFIEYDIPNQTLHANLDVFVNIAGGLMKGVGPGGLAGNAVFHFEPSKWYIHIGRPEPGKYVGVDFAGLAQATTYFMVGDDIPPLPPPPSNVTSILGQMSSTGQPSPFDMASGKGFATGAALNMDTGDLKWLIFYTRIAAGLGYDLNVRQYSHICAETGEIVGINGWFAQAQAYAYFDGEVGLKAKVFGKEKKFVILDLAAAVLLEAKLPNPSWFSGNIAGSYNILNGLIKGSFNKDVEFGQNCTLIPVEQETDPLDGIKIISDISPSDNTDEVGVFDAVQGLFNMPVNHVFTVNVEGQQMYTFKAQLDNFEVIDLSTGQAVIGTSEWDPAKEVITFQPEDVFTPNNDFEVRLEVSFWEKPSNSPWIPFVEDGVQIKESMVTSFSTGDGPDNIPDHNVAYVYPLANQYNFYPQESSTGYLKLQQGQDYLFQDSGWVNVIRFTDPNGQTYESPLTYAADTNTINYNFPTGIPNGVVLSFEFVKKPENVNTDLASNVSDTYTTVVENGVQYEIKNKTASGTLTLFQETIMYDSYLRSSAYNTLAEKVSGFSYSTGWRFPLLNGVHEVGITVSGNELFSGEEILGPGGLEPMVILEADLTGNSWWENDIKPLIYDTYPINGNFQITWRQTSGKGLPPFRACFIRQVPNNVTYDEATLQSGLVGVQSGNAAIVFNMAYYAAFDFNELNGQAANYFVSNPSTTNPAILNLINGAFTPIKQGTYRINLKYRLPGTNTITSTVPVDIYNPLN